MDKNKLSDEGIIEDLRNGIARTKKAKEDKKHPHVLICEQFDESFNSKLFINNNDEVLIQSRLPKDTDIGNIITKEKYNPDDYIMALAIKYCPFCSEDLNYPYTFEKIIESMEEELENCLE